MSLLHTERFTIKITEDVLSDLQARIRNTRLPDQLPGVAWEQGTEREYLRQFLDYWANEFDWRAEERRLNGYDHFRVKLDGIYIHFVHARGRSAPAIPLILMHGWPSCFVELLPLVPYLTDPQAHGIDGPPFDVVLPSLPGYGFSERPPRTGVNYRYVARLFHRLMQGLAYDHYGAQGGDFGAGVATLLALDEPDALIGIHLSNLEIAPFSGAGARPLSEAESSFLEVGQAWWQREGGYKAIQSTKPQTLAYSLNDSPAGLAAWILEKWRSWGDSGGDLDGHFSRDFLATLLTIFWVTQTIASSMRDYYDNRWAAVTIAPEDFVEAPTGIALFANQFAPEGEPPREWAERLYNVRRWTAMPRGGHFAPAEEPELIARDIAAFFAGL